MQLRMIQNERQYKVTKGQIAKLDAALKSSRGLSEKMDPRVYQAMIGGIEWEINRLQQQLHDFEELKETSSLYMHSVEDLPQILVKARIARGYTQKELAERLNIKPQQIQMYESTAYRSASWKRILEVLDALDMAHKITDMPTVIIAHTVKGKGVSFMEGKSTWHGRVPNDDELRQAMEELGKIE